MRIDHALGYNAATVVTWARHSHSGDLLNVIYGWLTPFLVCAIVIPAVFGKQQAKIFLLANIIAATIALPCFALVPAIGPWHLGSFEPTLPQLSCAHQIMALRHDNHYAFSFLQGAAIVCFPSFHVIWAVLAGAAFWGLRPLKIPAITLSALIILSTLTSGWHYLADVIAALCISAISLVLASRITTGSHTSKVSKPSEAAKDAEMEIV